MPQKRSVFTVKTYESQANGLMHMHSLMQQMQEIASRHAEELGFGMDWMVKNSCYWVLVNFKIEFTRVPKYDEMVMLRTWPCGRDLIKAFREFKGEDLQGNELFRATSDWMVIDLATQRPRSPEEFDLDINDDNGPVMGNIDRLRPQKQYQEIERFNVPYSSIDGNKHVNNTEYVRWGIDTWKRFDPEGTHSIRSMHITFSAEVLQNDEVVLEASKKPDGTIAVRGIRSRDGKNSFLMEISL